MKDMLEGRRAVDFNREMRDGPPGTAAGDDSELTDLGLSQAERLGTTYAPLLVDKAKAGKLTVFVSPFLRPLMTADPLMQKIREICPEFQATMLPAIMESGGLTAKEDFQKFDEIDALNKLGKRAEAIQFLKSIKWKPQGMNGNEIVRRFPWVSLDTAGHPLATPGIITPPFAPVEQNDKAWWTHGFESMKRAERRVAAVGEWITTAVREQTGDDDVVVFVCHGGTISELTNLLVNYTLTATVAQDHRLDINGIRNTSVTALVVPGTHARYIGERPTNSGEVNRYRVKVEQLNDTAHLGDEQLRFWAKHALGAKL